MPICKSPCYLQRGCADRLPTDSRPTRQPEDLGLAIVQDIPQDAVAYQQWRQKWANVLRAWDWTMIFTAQPIIKEDVEEMCLYNQVYGRGSQRNPPAMNVPIRSPKFDNLVIHWRLQEVSYVPWHEDLNLTWTYTVDLDHDVLSVNNIIHFKLHLIPRDRWIQAVQTIRFNRAGRTVIRSNLRIPATKFKDLNPPVAKEIRRGRLGGQRYIRAPTFQDFYVPRFDRRGVLVKSVECYRRPAVLFLLCLWTAFLKTRGNMRLAKVLHLMRPDEFMFKETAFAMLSIARGLACNLKFGYDLQDDISKYTNTATYIGDHYGHNTRHFATRLGSGYHEIGPRRGSAPMATTYWFGGIWVHLALNLDDPRVVDQEIQNARDFIRQTRLPREVLDILLFSIELFVVVRVDRDSIARTHPMRLFDIRADYLKSPFQGNRMREYRRSPTNAGECSRPCVASKF